MNVRLAALWSILVAASAGAVLAKPPQQVGGYLDAATTPDAGRILPPPPAAGGLRDQADRAAYLGRAAPAGPRWALATRDADLGGLLGDFSCALGVRVDAGRAPRLDRLTRRLRVDLISVVNASKNGFARKRPYQLAPGPICVPDSPSIAQSFDYPSGHAALGWTVGLVLAELAPDRATQVLVRARAFGESRAVCGVHSPSAVEAGRTGGAALVAALHGAPVFRADLEAARRELARVRRAGPAPDAAACAAEAELTRPLAY